MENWLVNKFKGVMTRLTSLTSQSGSLGLGLSLSL